MSDDDDDDDVDDDNDDGNANKTIEMIDDNLCICVQSVIDEVAAPVKSANTKMVLAGGSNFFNEKRIDSKQILTDASRPGIICTPDVAVTWNPI